MLSLLRKNPQPSHRSEPPVLDLSGPKLRRAFEHLAEAAEPTGGVERYVSALALKASLFEEVLGKGKIAEATAQDLADLAAFITPVRRRLGSDMSEENLGHLRAAIGDLLTGWSDVSTTDQRMAAFIGSFPRDKGHRWVRDLGAEILHYTAPDHYPLMTRWMWDRRVGSGVLREIWYSNRIDAEKIDVADDFLTFSTLAAEIKGFLGENGVYRDHVYYTDLLCAHIYAGYINDMGGQYLRSDFSDSPDPMLHTRRMLGLDAINTATGRTRLKLIDGNVHVLGDAPQLLN
jgi:hypothetical protein